MSEATNYVGRSVKFYGGRLSSGPWKGRVVSIEHHADGRRFITYPPDLAGNRLTDEPFPPDANTPITL